MASLDPNSAESASTPTTNSGAATPVVSSTAGTGAAASSLATSPPAFPGTAQGTAMATESANASTSPASEDEIRDLVMAFEAHDFGADNDFRAGLPAVIKAVKGRGSTAAQIDDVIARAQWFYFTRLKHSSVPFETYLRVRTRETESQPMKSPSSPVREMKDSPPPLQAASGTQTGLPPPASASAVTAAEGRVAETTAVAGEPAGMVAVESTTVTASSNDPPAIDEMKFADVVRLIAEGRADEVPVATIPDGINEAPPSVSTMKARPKPWERNAEATQETTEQTGEQQTMQQQ